ncbi:MAG TPA: hypothetical protein VIR79_05490 [Nitrospira sp.]
MKSEKSDRLRFLLCARERLIRIRMDIDAQAWGILETFGIRLGPVRVGWSRHSAVCTNVWNRKHHRRLRLPTRARAMCHLYALAGEPGYVRLPTKEDFYRTVLGDVIG